MPATVVVTGLTELRVKLKRLETEVGGFGSAQLKASLMDAADLVAVRARQKVPSKSGRSAGSIRPISTATKGAAVRGGSGVPYYGWLEFGGRKPVYGNPRSRGPWSGSGVGAPDGRFLYPAAQENAPQVVDMVSKGVESVLRSVGLI